MMIYIYVCGCNCRGSARGVVAKVLACDIVGNKFELQSRYYVDVLTNTLKKGMNPPWAILSLIVTLLFFYKDGFVI